KAKRPLSSGWMTTSLWVTLSIECLHPGPISVREVEYGRSRQNADLPKVKSPLEKIGSGPNRAGSAVRVTLLGQEAVITAPRRNWLKWMEDKAQVSGPKPVYAEDAHARSAATAAIVGGPFGERPDSTRAGTIG